MAFVRRRKFIGCAALVLSCGLAPPAAAVTGSSDTAAPIYRADAAPTAGNSFECDGYQCHFVITTQTSPYGCDYELIALTSGQATPALLYRRTYCAVRISGVFLPTSEEQSDPCALIALGSLRVEFTSGANALYDGAFYVSGFLKPTGFSADRTRITQAQVTVKGSGTLEMNPAGQGSVSGATFSVRLPTGIGRSMCDPYTGTRPGYVSAVTAHGTVVVAP